MIYSASSLGLYQSCGQAYKYKYIDRIPDKHITKALISGSIVHRILELSATMNQQNVLAIIVSEYNQYDLVKDLMEELKINILDKNFYRNLFATEHKIQFSYNNVQFIGIIDRINKFNEKSYEVIDYKYGKTEHTTFNGLQPQLYTWAMFEKYGFDIKLKFTYFDIKQKQKTSRLYIPSDIDMKAIIALIEKSKYDYQPNPDYKCSWCSFLKICQAGKKYLHDEIEIEKEDISEVGKKLLELKVRQGINKWKEKRYEELLKMYFESTGEILLKIEDKNIMYDTENQKLIF